MIIFLTTAWHGYTVKTLIDQSFGVTVPACMQINYEQALRATKLPYGTYVFCDIERLTPWELTLSAQLFRFLKHHGIRCLNDPSKVMTRVQLLQTLYSQQLNPFDVWRADEVRKPDRFPVFLRGECDHGVPVSDLIYSQSELEFNLSQLILQGIPLRGLIIIEYYPAPYNDTLWHKWGAYRIGSTYSTDHISVDNTWLVKYGDYESLTSHIREDELKAVEENRYTSAIYQSFELADIDFGRADFGMVDGKTITYEINTNPKFGHYIPDKFPISEKKQMIARENVAAALRKIDTQDFGQIDLVSIGPPLSEIQKMPLDAPLWRP